MSRKSKITDSRDVFEKSLDGESPVQYDKDGNAYVIMDDRALPEKNARRYLTRWDREKAAKWALATGVPAALLGAIVGRRLRKFRVRGELGPVGAASLAGGTVGSLGGLIGGTKRVTRKDRERK